MTTKKAPVLMIQGTGSHVGKSLITAAFCRYFVKQGLRVAPFKAQNMANNSFVCQDGGEIGRAQAVQAQACKIEPTVDMNPILIKPSSDLKAQIVFKGKPVGTFGIGEYRDYKKEAWPKACDSLDRLRLEYDLVIAEGAGSPAEINLRSEDIVNMETALYANADVLLVGDIDMGGVFAQFVGTLELISSKERKLIKGFIINKFRGDQSLLKPGIDFLERKTNIPVVGVIPFMHQHGIPEEDSLFHERWGKKAKEGAHIQIDIIRFPHISNFTDFDALEKDPRIEVRYLTRPPQNYLFPDMLILPGTKSTIADLDFLKESGLSDYIKSVAHAGKIVWGICGGFQMLGQKLFDPHQVESQHKEAMGLGLLPIQTTFSKEKTTTQVKGIHLPSQIPITGYEIHMGETKWHADLAPLFYLTERFGAVSNSQEGIQLDHIWGTYLHGVLESSGWVDWLVTTYQNKNSKYPSIPYVQQNDPYDHLAAQIQEHISEAMLQSYRAISKTSSESKKVSSESR